VDYYDLQEKVASLTRTVDKFQADSKVLEAKIAELTDLLAKERERQMAVNTRTQNAIKVCSRYRYTVRYFDVLLTYPYSYVKVYKSLDRYIITAAILYAISMYFLLIIIAMLRYIIMAAILHSILMCCLLITAMLRYVIIIQVYNHCSYTVRYFDVFVTYYTTLRYIITAGILYAISMYLLLIITAILRYIITAGILYAISMILHIITAMLRHIIIAGILYEISMYFLLIITAMLRYIIMAAILYAVKMPAYYNCIACYSGTYQLHAIRMHSHYSCTVCY
jgi:hypothetical protein